MQPSSPFLPRPSFPTRRSSDLRPGGKPLLNQPATSAATIQPAILPSMSRAFVTNFYNAYILALNESQPAYNLFLLSYLNIFSFSCFLYYFSIFLLGFIFLCFTLF